MEYSYINVYDEERDGIYVLSVQFVILNAPKYAWPCVLVHAIFALTLSSSQEVFLYKFIKRNCHCLYQRDSVYTELIKHALKGNVFEKVFGKLPTKYWPSCRGCECFCKS